MNRKYIENYLGITDNENKDYKKKVVAEYNAFKKKYPNLGLALTEDLGLYVPYSRIVETGAYITAFEN
ncbi:MAG: hypothetical protein IJW47_01165 [Clostridia bacterium]|nr:hypothetical protein [Clostridia bacterium]